jgi:hypothetical protein
MVLKHSPPSSYEVKERVELYLYSPLGVFMAGYRVNFIIIIIIITYMTALFQNSAKLDRRSQHLLSVPFSVTTDTSPISKPAAHQDTNDLPQGRPALRIVSQC